MNKIQNFFSATYGLGLLVMIIILVLGLIFYKKIKDAVTIEFDNDDELGDQKYQNTRLQ